MCNTPCENVCKFLCLIEPGYYEEGSFGIRLETDMEVIQMEFETKQKKFLKFAALTLVPFDANLIDVCMLTDAQVNPQNNFK